MVDITTSYVIENDIAFGKALDDALAKVDNLSFAFKEISRDWMKSNKAQFGLKGSGLYPPLSPRYAAQKKRKFPSASILVATGRLRDSVTVKGHKDQILSVSKRSLVMGSAVPYGIYHQSDRPRSKMPLRRFIFIGAEAPSHARRADAGRLERWLKIIEAEVARKLNA